MKFFNLDTPVMHVLAKIVDLVILNVLFVICSLPFFTIGASFTALYSVTLKMAKNEENTIVKAFFYAFKLNFKHSTLIWLIVFLFGSFLFNYVRLIRDIFGENATYMMLFILPLVAFLLLCVTYLFPYLAHFKCTTKLTFKNTFFIAIVHFPYTLLLMLLKGLFIWLFLFVQIELLQFVGILMGFSTSAYLTSIIYRNVFVHYEAEVINLV